MATTKNKDKFNFTRTDYYAAKGKLDPTEMSIWVYLADGHDYDKTEIARLNNISERTIERAYTSLKKKGYYIDGVFVAAPQEKKLAAVPVVVKQTSLKVVSKPREKETIKVEVKPPEEPVVKRWIDQF